LLLFRETAHGRWRHESPRRTIGRAVRYIPHNLIFWFVWFNFCIRNILTFGICELFGIDRLTKPVKNAEQVMPTEQANRCAAEVLRDGARRELDA